MKSSGRTEQVFTGKKWRDDRETSPERNKVWVEHKQPGSGSDRNRKVPVVYYLFRNGHLEQPHFMEVLVPSHQQGLSLRDVMNRLNFLRGKGMADMYSWAAKRSYRNGFVWQDLSESDIIQPVFGHEYVLKGSEHTETFSSFRSYKPSPPPPLAVQEHAVPPQSGENCDSTPAMIVRRRNQSWSSFDRQGEYKVYKAVAAAGETSGRVAAAADAATQTDDKRRQRRSPSSPPENTPSGAERPASGDPYRSSCAVRADLSREEVSPPPSSSSSTVASETMNSDGGVDRSRGVDLGAADIRDQTVVNDRPSGRMKASAVLMQLISCVSGPVKDGELTPGKDQACLERSVYGA